MGLAGLVWEAVGGLVQGQETGLLFRFGETGSVCLDLELAAFFPEPPARSDQFLADGELEGPVFVGVERWGFGVEGRLPEPAGGVFAESGRVFGGVALDEAVWSAGVCFGQCVVFRESRVFEEGAVFGLEVGGFFDGRGSAGLFPAGRSRLEHGLLQQLDAHLTLRWRLRGSARLAIRLLASRGELAVQRSLDGLEQLIVICLMSSSKHWA